MSRSAINLAEKFALFDDHWRPRVVGELNDYQFKIAKVAGDFIWHRHEETDEAFIVIKGELRIDLRDGPITLKAGELFVVPRGVEHKPSAAEEAWILMIEPRGVVNTGDAGGEMTAENDVWI